MSSQLSQVVQETNRNHLKKIANQSIIDWAKEHVNLQGAHGKTGAFTTETARWIEAPLLAAQDWGTRELVILKPTQGLGSTIAQVVTEWHISERPANTMMVMQTGKDAEIHMVQRLKPSFQANDAIAPLLPQDTRKIKIDGIDMAHMSFLINGPSRDRIHGKTLSKIWLDEFWRYASDSFLEYARKRLLYYRKTETSMLGIVSQAGYEGDDLDRAWKESTQEEWNVCCPNCKKHFLPDIELFNASGKKWNDKKSDLKKPDGSYNFGKLEKVLTLQCSLCNHLMRDTPQLKQFWNETGKYIATNPDALRGHRGFRWTSIVNDPWIDIVKEFLNATQQLKNGITIDLETFFQQRMARPINVWAYHVRNKSIKSDVDYNPKEKIPGEVARYMGIDVQLDSIWGVIYAFTAEGGMRLIWYGELFDVTDIFEKQKEYGVPPVCVLVDTGYRTREVYNWVIDFGFTGVKGKGGVRGFRVPDKKRPNRFYFKFWKKSDADPVADKGKKRPPIYLLAVDSIKDVLVRLRDGKGTEFLALPSAKYDIAEYTSQMFSEYKKRDTNTDGSVRKVYWAKVKADARNHIFDASVYALAGALMDRRIAIKENISAVSSDYIKESSEDTKEAA